MVPIETFTFRRTGETTEPNDNEDTIQNGNTKQIRIIKYNTHISKEMPVAIQAPHKEELKNIQYTNINTNLNTIINLNKHRKNCECCPGHYLIVNHYSSMS